MIKENQELKQRIAELERDAEKLPNEQGCNRYGLDMAYFRNVINRELNRPLVDYKPDELARVFARLSRTADKSVMFEPEFYGERNLKQQRRLLSKINSLTINKCNELDIYHPEWLTEIFEQLRKQQEGSE